VFLAPHRAIRALSISILAADKWPEARQRFYPATADEVFMALQAVVARDFNIKGADTFSRSVSFSTPMSGFSWGAAMSAQMIPVDGGAYVRVGGAAHVRTNITAKGVEYKNTIRLLDALSAHIQRNRAQEPAAGWYVDPNVPGQLRYWDGREWTEHRAPDPH